MKKFLVALVLATLVSSVSATYCAAQDGYGIWTCCYCGTYNVTSGRIGTTTSGYCTNCGMPEGVTITSPEPVDPPPSYYGY
ncbi:MAG: hypothetical protein Q4C78_05440 [Synergistaceae bacterium]|nr:hypothetical protein [Synergistaceae bacterium]